MREALTLVAGNM